MFRRLVPISHFEETCVFGDNFDHHCYYSLGVCLNFLSYSRENTNHWKVKKINSTEQRLGGFCPLTPKEIGIFLRALGYPPSSLIYIAAGEIYGGNTHLLELTSRFPNIVFKVCQFCSLIVLPK